MKAITIRQPHAALIAAKLKLVESRPKRTTHRGEIAIHAGKAWGRTELEMCRFLSNCYPIAANGVLHEVFDLKIHPRHSQFTFGAIIATAKIVDCIPAEQLVGISDMERAFGDYSAGRWGYMLEDIQPLDKPIYCNGQLGLWNIDLAAFQE